MGKKKKKKSFNTKLTSNSRVEKKNKLNKISSSLWLYFFVILIIGSTTCIIHFDSKLSLNGDNAGYIILGKSLLQGKYAQINTPEESKPFTKWPPGLPLIVAFSEFFSFNNFKLTKILIMLMSLGSALFFFKICTYYFNKFISLLITIFFIVNANIVEFSHYILSETPFMFFILMGIYFFQRRIKTNHFSDKNLIFSLISFSISFYFRTAGIAIIASLLILLFIEVLKTKKWKILLFSTILVVVIITPWQIRNKIVGGKNLHTQYQYIKVNPYRPELGNLNFQKLIERYYDNFNLYAFRELPVSFITNFRIINNSDKNAAIFLSIITLLLILIGIIVSLFRKKYRLFGIISVLFLLMTFYVPPVWATIRLILPIIPILILIIFISIEFIIEQIFKKPGLKNTSFIIFLILLFFFNLNGLSNLKDSIKDYPPNWKNYYKCALWVKNNTDENSIVCCRKIYLFYLWSERKTISYAKSFETDKVIEKLENKNADYVILEQLGFSDTARFLYPAIQNHTERFQIVYHLKNPDTYVLKFN